MKNLKVDMVAVFNSGEYKNIREVEKFLNAENIKTECNMSYAGTTLYVSPKDYYFAISQGAVFIVNNKISGISWVTPGNDLSGNLESIAWYAETLYETELQENKNDLNM